MRSGFGSAAARGFGIGWRPLLRKRVAGSLRRARRGQPRCSARVGEPRRGTKPMEGSAENHRQRWQSVRTRRWLEALKASTRFGVGDPGSEPVSASARRVRASRSREGRGNPLHRSCSRPAPATVGAAGRQRSASGEPLSGGAPATRSRPSATGVSSAAGGAFLQRPRSNGNGREVGLARFRELRHAASLGDQLRSTETSRPSRLASARRPVS